MKAILDEMLAALSRGERVVLCSILASSGSVPRGAGAKMAVFEDDRVLGTIGGGAVERLSIQRAQDALKNGGSNELKSYNLHPSEVASTGMICGGAVTVYFQFFAPEQTADVAVLKRWREMLDRDVDLWLLLSLDGDGVNEFHVVTREEIPQDKVDYFSAKAVWKDGIYVEPLCHAGSVYIFGGGHVGRALVPVLATVGFRVVMYDNREELAKKENYPMASEVIFGSFSRCLRAARPISAASAAAQRSPRRVSASRATAIPKRTSRASTHPSAFRFWPRRRRRSPSASRRR